MRPNRGRATLWVGSLLVFCIGLAGCQQDFREWDGVPDIKCEGDWCHYEGWFGIGVNQIWGADQENIYVCGWQQILFFDGENFSEVYRHKDSYILDVRFMDIWGSGRDDVWVVGSPDTFADDTNPGEIVHCVSGRCVRQHNHTPGTLVAVHGSSADNVWAVGSQSAVLHYNGQSWNALASPASTVWTDVATFGPGEVWLVGYDDNIWRMHQGAWERMETGLGSGKRHFTSLWAGAPDDVWFFGFWDSDKTCILMHWDGDSIERFELPWADGWNVGLGNVWTSYVGGLNAHDFWVTGDPLWHWDGQGWQQLSIPLKNYANEIWTDRAGEFWITGSMRMENTEGEPIHFYIHHYKPE